MDEAIVVFSSSLSRPSCLLFRRRSFFRAALSPSSFTPLSVGCALCRRENVRRTYCVAVVCCKCQANRFIVRFTHNIVEYVSDRDIFKAVTSVTRELVIA